MKQLKNGRGLTDSQMGFLLIVPGLAVFLAIILYPFVDAVITSFTDRSLIYPDYKFVAFANYAKVFKDPYFGKTLITTLLFVLGSTVLPYTLGMIWAIDLNQGFKGAEFLRGVTLVNWIIPGTAIGFLWSWIFNGQYGILNSILKALGILETGIPWLGQTNTALLCVIIARTWQMLPWYMAFLLGGLQSVSLDQIEAAHIDGANNWTTFWHIILLGMKQTAVLVFILGLIVSFGSSLMATIVCAFAGYSFAKFRYRGRKFVMGMFMMSQAFPQAILLLSIYSLMNKTGLLGSYWALLISYVVFTLPVGTWTLKSYFDNIPDSLIESAKIDGAGHWRIMTKIVFPMAVPGMISIAIYGFVWSWNDLLYSMTLVTDTAKRTLASGLVMTFLGEASTNWGYMMAASIVAAVPVTVIFVFVQRYFIQGLTAGAVKG